MEALIKPKKNIFRDFFGDVGVVRIAILFGLLLSVITYALASNVIGTFSKASAVLQPIGMLESITPDGKAVGWAIHPGFLKDSTTLKIFVDSVNGTAGQKSYTTTTQIDRPDINKYFTTTGKHGFEWAIPTELRDGKPHKLYIWADDKTSLNRDVLLSDPLTRSTFNISNNTVTLLAERKKVESPTQLFSFSFMNDARTDLPLTAEYYAKNFDAINYGRNQAIKDDRMQDIRDAGFKGLDLKYMFDEGFIGPGNMGSVDAQKKYCNSTQRSYKGYATHVNPDRGDFCRMHDSILASKKIPFPTSDSYFKGKTFDDFKFDHDVDEWLDENRPNPSPTPRIFASEDWFIHYKSNNGRVELIEKQRARFANGATKYKMDYRVIAVQEYIAGHFLRELRGGRTADGTILPRIGGQGIYLDVVRDYWDASAFGSFDLQKEYPSQVAYGDSVYDKICKAYNLLKQHNFTTYASIFWNPNYKPGQHKDILDCLTGMHTEKFAAIPWYRRFSEPAGADAQIRQYDEYLKQGKKLILTTGVDAYPGSEEYKKGVRYLWAAYMMVADGENVSFYSNSATVDDFRYWSHFYDMPEYHLKLGSPIEDRRFVGNPKDLKYERKFECGIVQADLINRTGSVTMTPPSDPNKPDETACKPGTYRVPQKPYSTGGFIYDSSTRAPVPGTEVTMTVTSNLYKQYQVTTKTGTDGRYKFAGELKQGDQYTLTISKVPTGYKSIPKTTVFKQSWNHCVSPLVGNNKPEGTRNGETRFGWFGYVCQRAGNLDCGSSQNGGPRDRCNFMLMKE